MIYKKVYKLLFVFYLYILIRLIISKIKMLNKKRTKMSRHRGSSSHGFGHKKKHRGAGHRGGVGLSGTGARGDQKKSMILTSIGKDYFGKNGFKSIHKKKVNVISLNRIQNNLENMIDSQVIIKEKDLYIFDSVKAKFDKILGKTTSFNLKLKIICSNISESAKQKVLDAGGEVIIFNKE